MFCKFSDMNLFSLVLLLLTATTVFANSSPFKPVATTGTGAPLNGLVVYVSDGAIFLGNDGSTVSQITDCGVFDVSKDTYAAIGWSGYLEPVDATKATPGFAIRGGKLVYKNSPYFYAVPEGSKYRLSVQDGKGATKVSILPYIPGGNGIVSDFEPKGICHGLGPHNVTNSTKTHVSTSSPNTLTHSIPLKTHTHSVGYKNKTSSKNIGSWPISKTHWGSQYQRRAGVSVSLNEAGSVVKMGSLGLTIVGALAALLL